MTKAEFVEWLEKEIKSFEDMNMLSAAECFKLCLEKAKQLEEPKQ